MRKKLAEKQAVEASKGGAYFKAPSSVSTFSSGCALLDCALGGGWAKRRLANLVGDSGSGKSLLAIEGAANFLFEDPKAKCWYVETEAAFDPTYAESLGIPMDRIELKDNIFTVEDMFKHMDEQIDLVTKQEVPGFYIVDSLDALSDAAELDREIDESSFGAAKAKKLSELFRRLNSRMSKADITVLIISQVRDNIGVAFGEKHTRSGGKALKFYASQEPWLAYTGQIEKTIKGVKNVIGVNVKVKVKKNRIGSPFRTCEFPIIFGYGVDDFIANVDWLEKVKRIDGLEAEIEASDKLDLAGFRALRIKVANHTKQVWNEIEHEFRPTRAKY